MNSKQRIERIEARRRRRVETVPDDLRARILAKLQQLADRGPSNLPKEQQSLAERLVFAETRAEMDDLSQRVRQMIAAGIQRSKELAKQPKAANWLKLQGKQTATK